jgi:predicted RNA-binding protein YlqC (UPF0109 family)
MAPGDLGRVIGRQGRTATALRALAAAAGELDGGGRWWTSGTNRLAA